MSPRRFPLLAAVVLLAAACAGPAGTDDPLGSPFQVTAPPATDEPVRSPAELPIVTPLTPTGESAGPTAVAPLDVTVIDTDWGPMWDALPADFPVFPAAILSEPRSEDGPVTAAFSIVDATTDEIANWMQSHLELATYSTEALSGPLDDGSFVIDSVGDAGCRIETTIRPTGGLILIGVRYGAACPIDE